MATVGAANGCFLRTSDGGTMDRLAEFMPKKAPVGVCDGELAVLRADREALVEDVTKGLALARTNLPASNQ